MSGDDIVTQLRAGGRSRPEPLLCDIAADEIVRLRAEVQEKRVDIGELIAQIVRRDDEIVRLRAVGDALAVRYRKTFGLDGMFDAELRQWEEVSRG